MLIILNLNLKHLLLVFVERIKHLVLVSHIDISGLQASFVRTHIPGFMFLLVFAEKEKHWVMKRCSYHDIVSTYILKNLLGFAGRKTVASDCRARVDVGEGSSLAPIG